MLPPGEDTGFPKGGGSPGNCPLSVLSVGSISSMSCLVSSSFKNIFAILSFFSNAQEIKATGLRTDDFRLKETQENFEKKYFELTENSDSESCRDPSFAVDKETFKE